jgi:hypothetical protein
LYQTNSDVFVIGEQVKVILIKSHVADCLAFRYAYYFVMLVSQRQVLCVQGLSATIQRMVAYDSC